MNDLIQHKQELQAEGFTVIANVFTENETETIIKCIEKADSSLPTFRKSADLFAILQNNFTVRIHLDDTDEKNGALRVVPRSHQKGIYRPETIDWTHEREVTCHVPKGGIMVMRPLLLHASSRTTNHKKRRVIHIEFSNQGLPEPLRWSELMERADYEFTNIVPADAVSSDS